MYNLAFLIRHILFDKQLYQIFVQFVRCFLWSFVYCVLILNHHSTTFCTYPVTVDYCKRTIWALTAKKQSKIIVISVIIYILRLLERFRP